VDSVDPRPGAIDELGDHIHLALEVAAEDLGEQRLLGSKRAVEARFVDIAKAVA
jgi:hypothetical protein